MLIYNFIYIILASLALLYPQIKDNQKKYIVLISSCIIILFQGLRWRTGTDWPNYEYLFYHSWDWEDAPYEIGFLWLNRLVNLIVDDYSYFLIIESAINVILIIWFARSLKVKNTVAVLLVVVIASNVFLIRFTLAVSFILCSYQYILKKKFVKFSILILVAFSIHRISIIFLFSYFVADHKFSFRGISIIYIVSMILGVATSTILGSMQYIAFLLASVVDDVSANKLDAYTSGENTIYGTFTIGRYILQSCKSFIFILLYYWGKTKWFKHSREYNMFFTLSFIGACFNRVIIMVSYEMIRITQFFSGGTVLMILLLIDKVSRKNRNLRIILLFIYFLYTYVAYYNIINTKFPDLYIPYFSVLDERTRPYVY